MLSQWMTVFIFASCKHFIFSLSCFYWVDISNLLFLSVMNRVKMNMGTRECICIFNKLVLLNTHTIYPGLALLDPMAAVVCLFLNLIVLCVMTIVFKGLLSYFANSFDNCYPYMMILVCTFLVFNIFSYTSSPLSHLMSFFEKSFLNLLIRVLFLFFFLSFENVITSFYCSLLKVLDFFICSGY